MTDSESGFLERLSSHGISRSDFLKYCSALAAFMALPPEAGQIFADSLEKAPRPSVIWLSFQECTGCTESAIRSHSPDIEDLILEKISLDYQETLMAGSGAQSEAALHDARKKNFGKYILIVGGSVATGEDGIYCCIAGRTSEDLLKEFAEGAAAIITVGTCASYGGIPMAFPNPTKAVPVSKIVTNRPIVSIPGCPPIPTVMTGVIAYFLTYGKLPELDSLRRPRAFFGDTIHDRCYRRPYYDRGKFAKSFQDTGAQKDWCLFELGCKGPVTHNSCARIKWNQGTSWPVESGHPCLGCAEPQFWDAGAFYKALSMPSDPLKLAGAALATGAALGAASALASKARKKKAKSVHTSMTLSDLKKQSDDTEKSGGKK